MRRNKIILSVIALLNVLFVPIYDVWGGLFPSNPDNNFFDVLEYVFEGEFSYWIVLFTIWIFIPVIAMLITSFTDGVIGFKLSSGFGAVVLIVNMLRYVDQNGMDELFDFDDGSVAIGTWIALVVFILSLIIVKKAKKGQFAPNKQIISEINRTNSPAQEETSQDNQFVKNKKFCPNCGTELDANAVFCGKCGFKLN